MHLQTDRELPGIEPTKPQTASTSLMSWLLLLSIGGVWGVTFSLAKLATEAGAHPLGIAWWQAALGAAMVFIYSGLRRRLPPFGKTHLIFYLVCGALGTAVPGALFFYAAPQIPAGVISITVAIVPMMTFALAIPLGVERAEFIRILGIVLGIAAVVMMVAPETSLPEAGMTVWVLVCVVASGCYAFENLWIALKRPPGTDAFGILVGMLLMATLMLTPVILVTESFVPIGASWGVVEWSVLTMAVVNTVSYGGFIYLVTMAGPVFASQTAYLVTLSGVFWGLVIFSEQHSWWIWAALVVMMAGLTLVKPREGGTSDG